MLCAGHPLEYVFFYLGEGALCTTNSIVTALDFTLFTVNISACPSYCSVSYEASCAVQCSLHTYNTTNWHHSSRTSSAHQIEVAGCMQHLRENLHRA